MGKTKSSKSVHLPLHQQLEDNSVRLNPRAKQRFNRAEAAESSGQEFIDVKLSKKILEQARLQQVELEEEHSSAVGDVKEQKVKFFGNGSDSESDSNSQDEVYDYDITTINPEDEQQIEQFMSNDPSERLTLAAIIQEKLTEKRTEIQTQLSDISGVADLDERVVAMYKKTGELLKKYRSGKIPKAFKVLPALANWEQILYLMEPDTWTAAAIYQATRIFSSSLNAKMAQRFINLILLPRVRDDIAEYKKLNFHLYMAVKKALYKPAAFFKGFLLPLCQSGTCTLREAVIVSSILHKDSIPMLHSAAAILKLAEMKYNGACSVFLRTLLDKKYALPYRVVDALVYHFLAFSKDNRELPVLWHQCLLVFAQRYKEDMSSEQKDALKELLKKHTHEKITLEIRRELVGSKCRDEEVAERQEMDGM